MKIYVRCLELELDMDRLERVGIHVLLHVEIIEYFFSLYIFIVIDDIFI